MDFKLISTRDRLPSLWTTYFVIIDGRKDIVTLPWIRKRVERYPENDFYWLEDTRVKTSPPAPSIAGKDPGFSFFNDRPWERS